VSRGEREETRGDTGGARACGSVLCIEGARATVVSTISRSALLCAACEEQYMHEEQYTPHQPRNARDALHRPRKHAPRMPTILLVPRVPSPHPAPLETNSNSVLHKLRRKPQGNFRPAKPYIFIFSFSCCTAYPLLNCVLIELPSMETKLQILWVLFDTLC
jgi:hypothetical protein